MAFTPGQPLDVMELNDLVDYPKIATVDIAGDSSAQGGSGGAGYKTLTVIEDPNSIVEQVNTTTVRVQPGTYFLDFPLRAHSSGWQYAQMYLNGVSEGRISVYDATSSMNTNMLKRVRTFTVPTTIEWYFEGGNIYATAGTIMMLKK